ncbi:MFS general substrate transporter [Eremomyces bilateralis CBS 781.70]|uniref:MFS general substrate transporter n=1 Tax=Eremomyces bilateralis CBS 781.70 TaxID=1392243 RepID=A0A6G1G6E2_9PEZI|nr:MFS general substrate transporter [Eremomyces bilateralis CBS 781.70]KAF1813623.1 MFS general substrate transporter [Eremomyces bilateralis CBS 781.70]
MADIGDHHFVKASKQVLVPQPSADKHDPLNWSLWWKVSAIATSSFVTFMMAFGPLALAPMFPAYQELYHRDLEAVVQFTGVCILVLGFSNFIWVPISTSFGRRCAYMLSISICLASMIWRALATSYGSFMGACVLNGIGAGPAETIQPAVITDIFFLHDRGTWNTFYWVMYMGSLIVAPIVSGPMAEHVGVASFWWLNTGLCVLALVMVVFCFPETKWGPRSETGEFAAGEVKISPDEKVANDEKLGDRVSAAQGDSPVREAELTREETGARDPWIGRGSPSRSQYWLYQPNPHPWKSIINDVWTPWKLFAFPIVEYAAFVVSWSCAVYLSINLTQSQALAAPPYDFSPQAIGFTNFAILIGALIGLVTAGPLSDWVAAKLTQRNSGIREPEMRLPAMIPFFLIMILGNIVVAVGYQHHWPWQAIVVIGFTCAGIQVAALPSISSTYAVDSYKPVTGSLFVAITVNKNVWGYGFSRFITPWSMEVGFIPPIMTNMALTAFFTLCGVIFFFYGKTFRRWSKNSKVHRM